MAMAMPMTLDLDRVFEQAQAGDPAALDLIVNRFYPRVEKMVHRQLQQNFRRSHPWIFPLFSTGDIVQEVFLRVIGGLGNIAGKDEASLVQYLGVMVRNRLLDALRFHGAVRRDIRREADDAAAGGVSTALAPDLTPSRHACLSERFRAYQEVLGTFDKRQRLLLKLRLERGESFPAIAERLGHSSADAARKAFHDAQARLLVRLRARGIRPTGSTLP